MQQEQSSKPGSSPPYSSVDLGRGLQLLKSNTTKSAIIYLLMNIVQQNNLAQWETPSHIVLISAGASDRILRFAKEKKSHMWLRAPLNAA